MGKFFQSDIIREELEDIFLIQKELYKVIVDFSSFNDIQKNEHIEQLKTLLDKQEIMWTRLSLSDDPEALEMKERIKEAAIMLGMDPESGINEFFEKMDETLAYLEEIADE